LTSKRSIDAAIKEVKKTTTKNKYRAKKIDSFTEKY